MAFRCTLKNITMIHTVRPFVFSALFAITITIAAQVEDPFNGSRINATKNTVSAFNSSRKSNVFNEYREKLNAEYVSLTRKKWDDKKFIQSRVSPDEKVKPVAPIVITEEEREKKREAKPIAIEHVVVPIKEKGKRVSPISPIPEIKGSQSNTLNFSYLGTLLQVRTPQHKNLHLTTITEDAIADAWQVLCAPDFNNMLIDCIKLRTTLQLCDWGYLQLLKTIGESFMGETSNEAVLLMAWLYSQSGYSMRLARANEKLEMLYASRHKVYGTPYFNCDGEYFYRMSKTNGDLAICKAKYPKEQSLSLWMNNNPRIAFAASDTRTLTSKQYPISIHVSINKNLLPFFSSYPSSEVGGDFMTRWAMYANTTFCDEVKEPLYQQLRKYIDGKSELEAIELLLNWVQTAFTYEYDDKIWGYDRAFFPEETLRYPYCDCEDRSILFTRLVRDLLGLQCLLIYYPGHLATAVQFNESVNGDYIILNGSRYIVCDPTFIGAPVGRTMDGMDNSTADVIILN